MEICGCGPQPGASTHFQHVHGSVFPTYQVLSLKKYDKKTAMFLISCFSPSVLSYVLEILQ